VSVKLGEVIQDAKCPNCDTFSLRITLGFVSAPDHVFSVPGMPYKMTAWTWPFLVCSSCEFEAIAKGRSLRRPV
jgi:hypothetical protein